MRARLKNPIAGGQVYEFKIKIGTGNIKMARD
jgi:hypothetical protein